MKVTLCDICNRPLDSESYKIKCKKHRVSWYESWWDKIDICSECGDLLFLLVNHTRLREEIKAIREEYGNE